MTTITKQNVIEVNPQLISKIKEVSEQYTYTADSYLYYENQTPVVAYLLLEGEAIFFKKRRKSIHLKPGSIFGLKEHILHEKSTYGAEIAEGSQVCFLDRSTLKEILNIDVDLELRSMIEKLLMKKVG